MSVDESPKGKPKDSPIGDPLSDEAIRGGLEGRRVRAQLKARMFGAKPPEVRLGPYRVIDKLGEGGSGAVYRTEHVDTGEPFAVKVLREQNAGAVARLRREGKAMAALAHPGIAKVHEFGECDDGVYVAMEYVAGGSMRGWMQQPRTLLEVVDLVVQACEAIAAAHALGVVHRDIKPDNILIDVEGRARVVDFGLAKSLPNSDADGLTAFGQRLTVTGAMLGTVGYMAPEQLTTGDITAAVDQFALAVTTFEALYGTDPFRGSTRDAIALAILNGRITEPAPEAVTSPAVHAVVLQGMRSDPKQRFESVAAFGAALRQALEPAPPPRRGFWSRMFSR